MNKDVEQHLQELIDFYSKTDIADIDYLKKLFVRNLKDVQRRYIKYDKPRKEILDKAKEYIKETELYQVVYDDEGNYFNTYDDKATADLLQILGDK